MIRNIFLTVILCNMFFSAVSQNLVYNSEGKKVSYESDDLDIVLEASDTRFPSKKGAEFAPALLALIPSLVDIGFQLTGNIIEKRARKFSAEYVKQKSFLDAGKGLVPHFKLIRTIETGGSSGPALMMSFKVKKVEGLEGFIYYLDSISLDKSSAKATGKQQVFDYTIEIKPTFIIDGEKKVQELSPLVISSVRFGKKDFKDEKHRTDIIPMPAGSVLSEIAVKVIETNQAKVRAEKILSLWNANKDSVKTIINNFLPAAPASEEVAGEESETKSESAGSNESTGNDEKKKKVN